LKFKYKVSSKIDKFITAIFDDRLELATKAIAQAIAFYNYFLERQERYQQETPEQREAEKAWIDQQRQELARVQNGIEAILSADAD
jgi:CRISPR/Cas system-associated endonuclease Cas1